MFRAGDIITYLDMCNAENTQLQRGMNFRLSSHYSVVLMSTRPGAPYADRVEEDGKLLIYEGHDINKTQNGPNPKTLDQPMFNKGGSLTQNGMFYQAAQSYKQGHRKPEVVKVYEKIRDGIWVYNGTFHLLDAWQENDSKRKVFKFNLYLIEGDASNLQPSENFTLEHSRFIPSLVKREVWVRDKGQCVLCGSNTNLHFDHIIPFSKGGTSLKSENIQLLCATHNLAKRDRIE